MPKNKIRRFEQVWAKDTESHQLVKLTWKNSTGDSVQKLHNTLNQLLYWGKTKFGDIPRKVKDLQDSLDKLKNRVPTQQCLIDIKKMEKDLDVVLKEEELWWAQRAKINWLQHGDLNRKFFHYKANQRRSKNTILGIKDDRGNLCQESHQVHSIFDSYIHNIFTSSTTTYNTDIFSVVQNRVSQDMCSLLESDILPMRYPHLLRTLKAILLQALMA
jgi:hypothetical protein